MALHINNQEADRLAQELIALTGETKTVAIIESMKERLQKLRQNRLEVNLSQELAAIADRYSALPVYDTRTTEEILGYDENGLPS